MMDGGMGFMMAWMMGFGLLGWVLVIALLVTILFVLVRLLNRPDRASRDAPPADGRYDKSP
jgi:hypothetical protein